MSTNSLGDPFDSQVSLLHTRGCECAVCAQGADHKTYSQALEAAAGQTTKVRNR